MLQAYTELSKTWNKFLVEYVLNPAMDIVLSVRRLGFSFELRPSRKDSYHVPREWRSGAHQDLVAIEVVGNVERMIDVFVHELGHVEFTPRDELYRELLRKYGDACNLVEDVRVEYLIRQKYGWVFSTWEYPEKEVLGNVIDKAPLIAWLYVKKVASSRGEDVPEEYVELFRAKVGEEKLEELERAYESAISIKTSQDMKAFLEKHLPKDEEKAIQAASEVLLAQGRGQGQGQGQGQEQEQAQGQGQKQARGQEGKEEQGQGQGRGRGQAQEQEQARAQGQGQGRGRVQEKVKASGGGSDLAKGEKEIQRIEEETRGFEEELKKALGLGEEAEEGVGQDKGFFGLKAGRGSGGIRFNEKHLQIKKDPQLEEYLRWLCSEESRIVLRDKGFSVNLEGYVHWVAEGKRGKAKIFNHIEERKRTPKVAFVVDTSGSMGAVDEEVRELLWAVVELSKRELLEGKVVFTGDGDALAVSLPTNKPIWTVVFSGGTNGYDKALKHIEEEEFVIFVSDLDIDSGDIKFVKELYKNKEGQVFFLYGGEQYEGYLEKARQTFPEIPVSNLFFAVNVPLALQKLVQELGYRTQHPMRRI